MAKYRTITAAVPPPIRSVNTKDWLRWGADDRYPNRTRELVGASGTAASAVATKAKLIEGNGFADATFWKSIINRKGQTLDQLVRLHSDDLARLSALAFLVNINGAGYACEVLHLPISQWRPGLPDDTGRVEVAFQFYSPVKGKTKKPTAHLVFDPREAPADRAARALSWPGGLAAYPGEIYYYVHPGAGYLPTVSYDAAMVDIETEGLLKKSRRADIKGGYAGRTLITEYGSEDPSQEKMDADAEKYQPFVGQDVGDRVVIQWAKDKDSKPTIDQVETPDASDRYAKDGGQLRLDIRAVFQIPDILYGEAIAGKLGLSTEFEDAITYAQNFVVNTDQRAIETAYAEVFGEFQPLGEPLRQINPSQDYSIQNLSLNATQVEVPTQSEQTLKALNSMSPLVATKVLEYMSKEDVLAMVGITAIPEPAA